MNPHFNGADYQPELDFNRLSNQLGRVFKAIQDGQWHTLGELAGKTGDPEASISAQLRHLRKKRFGSHIIERRRAEGLLETVGLYEYRWAGIAPMEEEL